MTEWIRQVRDAAPRVLLDIALERRAGSDRAIARRLEILDREVEVDRRPVARVVAAARACERRRARRLREQVDRRCVADELERGVAEPASDAEVERRRVEGGGGGEIGDVDVDQHAADDRAIADR